MNCVRGAKHPSRPGWTYERDFRAGLGSRMDGSLVAMWKSSGRAAGAGEEAS
jgi:hypothetical protein